MKLPHVAFLFDNDGVLIDSSELHWRSWELLIEEEGSDFKLDHQSFLQAFGKRNDLILKEIVPHLSEEKRTALAKRKEELFRECARGKVKLLPGIEPFLEAVKSANIPRVIASSTPIENLEMFIESTVLGKFFDDYLSAEQVAHGKPAPDIFLAAAKHLGFEPRDCIVFEDAPAGIQAGKTAGCFVVALGTTHKKDALSDYDLFYSSPDQLNLQEILQAFSLQSR